MMTYEELKHKEESLRHCYEKALHETDVDGTVTLEHAKMLRLRGALWHHAKELLEEYGEEEYGRHGTMTADNMEVHASGIKSIR